VYLKNLNFEEGMCLI